MARLRPLALLAMTLAVAGSAGARSSTVVFRCADGEACDSDGVGNGTCRVSVCVWGLVCETPSGCGDVVLCGTPSPGIQLPIRRAKLRVGHRRSFSGRVFAHYLPIAVGDQRAIARKTFIVRCTR